jgi:hypothetical protein
VQGATGPQGATGAQGPQGPQGPSGVISTTYGAGACTAPGSAINWISTTVTVTVASNQSLTVMSSAGLGAGGTAASNLNIYPCYRDTAGTTISTLGGGIFGLTAPVNSRNIYSISGVIKFLTPGTYQVGMCGQSTSTAWTNNEWSYTSAIVSTP